MIVDRTYLESDKVPPIVIIGSGPAGITLSVQLAQLGIESLILEAGGEDFSADSQDVYIGRVIGDDYYDLDLTRLRYFGGSSNHWEGWCRPLDAHDFLPREDIPGYGWPIRKTDLDPYAAMANEILEIPAVRKQLIGDDLIEVEFAFSPPVRFGEKYRDFLARSDKAHIVFDAPVQSLEAGNGRIRHAVVATPDGDRILVSGRSFVLCTGGIENSRLLLWSNETSSAPVVSTPATLGRYWMEHPHSYAGAAEISARLLSFKSDRTDYFFLAPSYEAMRRHGILNGTVRVPPVYYGEDRIKDSVKTLVCNTGDLGQAALGAIGTSITCLREIQMVWEQEPRADNRISLDPDRSDTRGVPSPILHWTKSPLDYRTPKIIFELFGAHIVENRLGRVKAYEHLIQERDYPTDAWMGGHHHMGGTRMAETSSGGVVDADLKIFGLDNGFVAGSSVFPTAGHANPTFTIVQLSLRLADHLAATL